MIFKAAVLIAEDETVLRSIAVEVLEQCGFFVFAAADGEAALEVLKAHAEIALLISDIQMPRMNGYTLIAAALEFRPELKVIIMTAYAPLPPAAIAARKLKILRKPFDIEDLCAVADSVLAA